MWQHGLERNVFDTLQVDFSELSLIFQGLVYVPLWLISGRSQCLYHTATSNKMTDDFGKVWMEAVLV
jgi:hypothetical protein